MTTPNYDTPKFISRLATFNVARNGRRTSNLWGVRNEDYNTIAYEVYSYWTLMARVENGRVTYLDNRRYSNTTSKHQGYIRAGLGGLPVAAEATILERKGRR